MMASSSYPAPVSQVALISPQFCVGYPVDLIISRRMMSFAGKTFEVTDVNGNIVFKVEGKAFSIHDRRVLLDAAGNPLLTVKQNIVLSADRRWQAFRGESTDEKDLIFSVKMSLFTPFLRNKLDIFFASNTREDVCDFRIEGLLSERSFVIYAGATNNIIAHMHKKKKHRAKSFLFGKDTFGITVYPNVDYAFIVALMVIIQEINMDTQFQRQIRLIPSDLSWFS